jgi:hypothetical protein
MATLHQKIAEKFLAKLTESTNFDAEKIERLRKLLVANDKKLKSEDFVKVFRVATSNDEAGVRAHRRGVASRSWTLFLEKRNSRFRAQMGPAKAASLMPSNSG